MKWAEVKAKLKAIGRQSQNRRTKIVAAWLSRDDEGQLFIDRPSGWSMVLRFLKQRRVDKSLWAAITKAARAFELEERPVFKTIKYLSRILARDLAPEDRALLEEIRRRAITTLTEPTSDEEEACEAIAKRTTPVKYPDYNTRAWEEMKAFAKAEEEAKAAALAAKAAREAAKAEREAAKEAEAAKYLTDEDLGLGKPLVDFESEEDDEAPPPPPPPTLGDLPKPLLDFDFGFDQ